mmetsp:Transcript_52689/g.146796  ORF Transcript_52689/g.146796 Transcript_52689/m.146796 type:complete len:367 (+) Transcript_52689:932-2032(+)
MPLHVAEQPLHSVHCDKRQSTGAWHETPTLQNTSSRSLPVAGSPQRDAILLTRRTRNETPPPQDSEHGDHGCQSSQRPSTHASVAQGAVAHACTSSFVAGGQKLPSPLGIFAMSRERVLWPPPHVHVQPLQSDQLPHSQSVRSHGRRSHGRVSASGSWHGSPSRLRSRITRRLRCCWPAPHVAEHEPHPSQSPTPQSTTGQGSVLHPAVCSSWLGQGAPEFLGYRLTERCRCFWPLPQLRSQLSQAVQSETWQSTGVRAHVSVSSMEPWHGAPMPSACVTIDRSLSRCPPPAQPLHVAHAVSTQSLPVSLQGMAPQDRSCSKLSTHVRPPPRACSAMRRDLVCVPTPQLRVHGDQADQPDKRHGAL